MDEAGYQTLNFSHDVALQLLKELRDERGFLSPPVEVVLISIYSLLVVFGLVGNSLVWMMFVKRPRMRTPTNIYILLLAASDIFLCLLLIPVSVVRLVVHNWSLGPILCRVEPLMTCTFIYISSITIAAMAIDRYRIIVRTRPHSSNHRRGGSSQRQREMRITLMIAGVIVLVSVLLSLPIYFYSHLEVFRPCFHDLGCFTLKTKCVVDLPAWQHVLLLVIQYLLPLLALAFTDIRISHFLSAHVNRIARRQSTVARRRSTVVVEEIPLEMMNRNNLKTNSAARASGALRLLISITVVFFITWLPWSIFNIIVDFFPQLLEQDPRSAFYVMVGCHLLAHTAICSNPLLYVWLNNNFREEALAYFTVVCRSGGRVRREAVVRIPTARSQALVDGDGGGDARNVFLDVPGRHARPSIDSHRLSVNTLRTSIT